MKQITSASTKPRDRWRVGKMCGPSLKMMVTMGSRGVEQVGAGSRDGQAGTEVSWRSSL